MVAGDLGKAENKFETKQHDYIYMYSYLKSLLTLSYKAL